MPTSADAPLTALAPAVPAQAAPEAARPLRHSPAPADRHPQFAGFHGPAAPTDPARLDPDAVLAEYGNLVEGALHRLPQVALRGTVADIDDLRQEGLLALLDAAATFQAHRGVPFVAYARTCITNALSSALRRVDPLPEAVRRDLRALRAAEEAITNQAAALAGDDRVLADRAGLSVERVAALRGWQVRERALGADAEHDAAAWVDPRVPSPEEEVLAAEDVRAIQDALAALPERTRRILLARLVDDVPVTELAAREGVHHTRISQIHRAALRSLTALLGPA